MKNYIKEYFTNPKNVMNETIINMEVQKFTPDEFFESLWSQENSSVIFKHIHCKDWFHFSIQASYWHYCEPRVTHYSKNNFIYESMEVWYPSEKVEELMPYSCQEEWVWEWVYWQVPVELLNKIIEKHWGINTSHN